MIGFKPKIVTLLAGGLVVRKFREAALVAVSNDRWPAVWLVCREASVELGWAAGEFWGGWVGRQIEFCGYLFLYFIFTYIILIYEFSGI